MRAAVILMVVLLLAVLACRGPAALPPPTPPPPPATPASAVAPALTPRVEVMATGLEVPWALAFSPDGRIFITERPGRLRVISDGVLLPQPVAVLPVATVRESGLLGLALDPEFEKNHFLYVYYTYREGRELRNRVVRLTEAGGRAGEPVVLLEGIPGATIHDGGRLGFGPDGRLYITAGDSARELLAPELTSLAGKVLRLNPDGSIPQDNPFPGSPVFTYGHRNPQGLAWQPATGQLYATEHGPRGHDEVNIIRAGANYGWPAAKGRQGMEWGFSLPVAESGSGTWAPSGATFYTGPEFPQWRGHLFFAGLRSTALWHVDPTAPEPLEPRTLLEGRYGRLRDVVQGPDGSLYLLTSNRDGRGDPAPEDDRLLRLAPAGP
ncbi:MAG: PQQ-dependent sugar dehydrogenase [Dehalococcoidia bacterium]